MDCAGERRRHRHGPVAPYHLPRLRRSWIRTLRVASGALSRRDPGRSLRAGRRRQRLKAVPTSPNVVEGAGVTIEVKRQSGAGDPADRYEANDVRSFWYRVASDGFLIVESEHAPTGAQREFARYAPMAWDWVRAEETFPEPSITTRPSLALIVTLPDGTDHRFHRFGNDTGEVEHDIDYLVTDGDLIVARVSYIIRYGYVLESDEEARYAASAWTRVAMVDPEGWGRHLCEPRDRSPD